VGSRGGGKGLQAPGEEIYPLCLVMREEGNSYDSRRGGGGGGGGGGGWPAAKKVRKKKKAEKKGIPARQKHEGL